MPVKFGGTHFDEVDHEISLYKDVGFRYAKSINDRFAFKVNASWLNAQDFIGVDYRDQSGVTVEGNLQSNRQKNRIYDGVNVYGDFLIDIGTVADIVINDPSSDPNLAGRLTYKKFITKR